MPSIRKALLSEIPGYTVVTPFRQVRLALEYACRTKPGFEWFICLCHKNIIMLAKQEKLRKC
jgi:hypothetical protein